MKIRTHRLAFSYMVFWSVVIGMATGAYLQVINWLIALVWRIIPTALHLPTHWRPWLILLPMGLIIGISQHFIGQYPLEIAQVLGEIKEKGHFNYHNWYKILICSLLVLGAGGSIGPEASLSGLIAGMVYWLGCRYKLIIGSANQLTDLPWHTQLIFIVTEPLKAHQDLIDKPISHYFNNVKQKKHYYWCWTLFGVIGLILFFKVFPQEGVIGIHKPSIHWQWHGLAVVIPAIIIGWLFGKFFVQLGEWSERWLGRAKYQLIKGLLGGLLLATATSLSQDVLFSGEFAIQGFAKSALTMSPLFLLAFAFTKAFVTNVGFSLGWRGGTIFPAIFSSLAIGAFAAQLIGWMPSLTVTIVTTVAITTIIERPLLTAVLLWLLLPIQFAPIILVIAYLTKMVNQQIQKLTR